MNVPTTYRLTKIFKHIFLKKIYKNYLRFLLTREIITYCFLIDANYMKWAYQICKSIVILLTIFKHYMHIIPIIITYNLHITKISFA